MSGLRRAIIWNKGPKHDFSKLTPKKRRVTKSSASTSTSSAGSSRLPDSAINIGQDAPDQSITDQSMVSSQVQVDVEGPFQSTFPLDSFTSYVTQLRQQSALTMCDPLATVFALPDFNDHLKLMVNKYHIVERCSKTVGENCEWFYCCTCSRREQDLVMSLSTDIVAGASRLRDKYCIHINAVIQIVSDLDKQYDLQPSLNEEDHSYTIPSRFADLTSPVDQADTVFKVYGDGMFCSKSDDSYGILNCSKDIRCLTCSYGCQSCDHVKQLKTLLANEHEVYSQSLLDVLQTVQAIRSDNKVSRSVTSPVCVSSKGINFNVSPGQFQHTAGYQPRHFTQNSDTVSLVSSERCCAICGHTSPQTSETAAETGAWPCIHPPLITRNFVFKTKVYQRPCVSCNTILDFDGGAEGILNMGAFLISHEIMRDYMYHFLQTGMTMFAYYETLCKHMEDAGVPAFRKVLTYNNFRHSWYAFLELLDINYSEGFMCSLCGPAPKVVICDGTALSFRRELLPWQQVLEEDNASTEPAYTGRYSNIPANYRVVETIGNGDCLFNAISLVLTGTDAHAATLRLGAAVYGATHAEHIVEQYMADGIDNIGAAQMVLHSVSTQEVAAACKATNVRDILMYTVKEEAKATAKIGAYSGLLQLTFLSGFCGYAITLHCEDPTMDGYDNRMMAPCGCEEDSRLKGELKVMLVRGTTTRTLNHFVGLVKSSGRITRKKGTHDVAGPSCLPGIQAADQCSAQLTLGCNEKKELGMIQCQECLSWYHNKCVPVPESETWENLPFQCCAENRAMVYDSVPDITLLTNLSNEPDSPWKVHVKLHDVVSLRPTYWLTSGVVDFYGRQLAYGMSERGQTNIKIMPTTFLEEVRRGRHPTHRQTTCTDIIMMPVCSQDHWKLYCLQMAGTSNLQRSQLLVLDSLTKKYNSEDIGAVKRYLSVKDLETTSVKVPQQGNCWDCGAFLIYNMAWVVDNYREFAAKRTVPDRPEGDIGIYMRRKIRNDLFHCMNYNMAEPTTYY